MNTIIKVENYGDFGMKQILAVMEKEGIYNIQKLIQDFNNQNNIINFNIEKYKKNFSITGIPYDKMYETNSKFINYLKSLGFINLLNRKSYSVCFSD